MFDLFWICLVLAMFGVFRMCLVLFWMCLVCFRCVFFELLGD